MKMTKGNGVKKFKSDAKEVDRTYLQNDKTRYHWTKGTTTIEENLVHS